MSTGKEMMKTQMNPMTDTTRTGGENVAAGRFTGKTSRRGLLMMVAIEILVIAALINAVFGVVAAHAFDGAAKHDRLGAELAYAPPAGERFGVFDPYLDEMTFEDEHPMNDAWMGMSVVTAEGATAGYVSDAFLNEDGTVDEIIVTPAEGSGLAHAVFVPARYVLLGETAVTVDMTLAVLKTQEAVTSEFAAAQ